MEVVVEENGRYPVPLPLSFAHYDELRNLRFRLEDGEKTGRRVFAFDPGPAPDTYYLRATDVVGIVKVGGLSVAIRPKCGAGKLAEMLNRSTARVNVELETVNAEQGDLVRYLSRQFLDLLDIATAEGLEEGYSVTTEIGHRPKGRVHFGWFGSGTEIPTKYTYDAYTPDIVENRMIRAVLTRIIDLHGIDDSLGKRAYLVRDAFDVSDFDGDVDSVIRSSSIPAYFDVLAVGGIILRAGGIEPQAGKFATQGLLFYMPAVYESFICTMVEDYGEQKAIEVDLQGVRFPRFLGERSRLKIHPDFSLWQNGECLLVGDVKYKKRKVGAPRPDLYQMFAYSQLTAAPKALLVYAGPNHGTYELEFNAHPQCRLSATSIDIERLSAACIREAIFRQLDSCLSSTDKREPQAASSAEMRAV